MGPSESASVVGTADLSKLKISLARKAMAAIKKAAHNDKKKPHSEICEGLPRSHALAFLGSLGTVVSDSKRVHKRTLSPQDVEQLLGIVDIHPVKFDGKVLCFAGQRPSVYAWAKVESAEV